jgi:hypothetical protein
LNVCCVGIDNGVIYTDLDGTEHTLPAGTVVVAAGMRPRTEEAIALADSGNRFELIGDCKTPGNVQQAMRSAFSAAVRL